MAASAQPTATARPALMGNRLVLAGAVLYLLEWVAIIAGGLNAPLGAAATAGDVHAAYAGQAGAFGWAAGWFSVVLLGRVLIMTGLRTALAESGRPQRWMDVAVAAMAVSVALEVATYAVVAGAAWSLDEGGSAAVVRSLDAVAFEVNETIYGPLGVSLLCAAAATWLSGLFTRVLSVLAGVAGLVCVVTALAFEAPRFAGLADALTSVVLLFWVWMIWTGVVLWRASPARHQASAAPTP